MTIVKMLQTERSLVRTNNNKIVKPEINDVGDIDEAEKYIESIMSKNINDITMDELDSILEYNKATTYLDENYIKLSSKHNKNKKQVVDVGNITKYLTTGIIELNEDVSDEIHPCMPTIMDTKGIISLLNVEDGTRHGIVIQLQIPQTNEKIKMAPNHIAAMDNITTWSSYNKNISVDQTVDNNKQKQIMSQINLNEDIDRNTEVFLATSNSKDGLVGITTKINTIYKMKTSSRPKIVAISIVVPKVEIKGAISGCPIISGQSIFIANAARENDALYEIFAVSVDHDTPSIMYKNSTSLRSKEIVHEITKVNQTVFKPTNMIINEVINLSSYPSSLILNYLSTETKWKVSDKTQIRPILPTLKIINNYLELQIFARKMILVVFDYDDKKAAKKLSWIMQINRNIYRAEVIDLANIKINEFDKSDLNEYNVVSYHIQKSVMEKQNFTNINSIPNNSYVSVYADNCGVATYTGLVKVLQTKGCKIRIVRVTLGPNLDINWSINSRTIIDKNIAEDSLVADETNWRYKACFMQYVDTPFGPYKLEKTHHGGKPKSKFTIMQKKKKENKKLNNKMSLFFVIRLSFKMISYMITIMIKTSYKISKILTKFLRREK